MSSAWAGEPQEWVAKRKMSGPVPSIQLAERLAVAPYQPFDQFFAGV